jgi:hypothetical protein
MSTYLQCKLSILSSLDEANDVLRQFKINTGSGDQTPELVLKGIIDTLTSALKANPIVNFAGINITSNTVKDISVNVMSSSGLRFFGNEATPIYLGQTLLPKTDVQGTVVIF